MNSFPFLPLGGFISVSLSLSYLRENNKRLTNRVGEDDGEENEDTWKRVPSPGLWPHGVNHLFKSLEGAGVILRLGSKVVMQHLTRTEHDDFYGALSQLEQRVLQCRQQLSRTIVVEGCQGTGATTLISGIASTVPSAHAASTNKWNKITKLRHKLQFLPLSLREAFFSVCDYCSVVDIEEDESTGKGFILLERLHHSRVSHAICANNPSTDPASLGESAFCWPNDLPRPALVVYLFVPYEVKEKRQNQVHISPSEYNKIQFVHSRVTGPLFTAVDASGTPQEVLETVLECCSSYGVNVLSPTHVRDDIYTEKTQQDHDCPTEQSLFISFDDEASSRSKKESHSTKEWRRKSRQSMGWYGAFMSSNTDI